MGLPFSLLFSIYQLVQEVLQKSLQKVPSPFCGGFSGRATSSPLDYLINLFNKL